VSEIFNYPGAEQWPASPRKIVWPIVFWLGVIHVGAIAALFNFTWPALAVAVALAAVSGMSITLGYHRMLTHNSFKTTLFMRRLLAFMGSLAGQGGPLQWVADHRRHHKFADAPGDPHSPREGFWWAHATWNFFNTQDDVLYYMRWTPDLWNDPVLVRMNYLHVPAHFALAAILFAVGGWPFLLWGMFARLTWVLHTTWLVNSWTHGHGYRNFHTDDDSTNSAMIAAVTFGEGWHNNHHAHPWAANHGRRWNEVDPTYMVIRGMEAIGLAWDVKTA
jgi:fatty-acid desaturase